ncbi:unnamed protein product [Schistosoma mattheei]|uniref:Uncharacterized protein n=1 Tax=Schistosoma mattheei TaxID=31246 RepID=A0A183PMX7_9TREM|nr:unnamed protein product [Schistosoma mattheei]
MSPKAERYVRRWLTDASPLERTTALELIDKLYRETNEQDQLTDTQFQIVMKRAKNIIDEHGRSAADVKARIGKAREAYLQLKNIWNSKQLSTVNIKVRISNTNVNTVLLYGEETWTITKAIIKKIRVFINNCLRKTRRIRWPNTISNNVWERTNQITAEEEALEVDRTHIEESAQLRHKASPHLESAKRKEKWKTKDHITQINGERHEKNEQQLDTTRKEGSGQRGLENDGR